MALDPMTYAVSAVRRGFHGAALPARPRPGVVGPHRSGIVAGFAVVALAAAVALCRRRA